jgi:hypothetical protein
MGREASSSPCCDRYPAIVDGALEPNKPVESAKNLDPGKNGRSSPMSPICAGYNNAYVKVTCQEVAKKTSAILHTSSWSYNERFDLFFIVVAVSESTANATNSHPSSDSTSSTRTNSARMSPLALQNSPSLEIPSTSARQSGLNSSPTSPTPANPATSRSSSNSRGSGTSCSTSWTQSRPGSSASASLSELWRTHLSLASYAVPFKFKLLTR